MELHLLTQLIHIVYSTETQANLNFNKKIISQNYKEIEGVNKL